MVRIHFTPEDIYNKHFHMKMRGYDPLDVDSFLDMIIRDYKRFYDTERSLYQRVKSLRSQQNTLYVNMNHKINLVKNQSSNLQFKNTELISQVKSLKHRLSNILSSEQNKSQQNTIKHNHVNTNNTSIIKQLLNNPNMELTIQQQNQINKIISKRLKRLEKVVE